MAFKKTRYAPTPSGLLHLGNLYSMALTAAVAKKEGATILLRVDDMDKARAKAEYLQDLFDCLPFFDLPWQEGPKNSEELKTRFSQTLRRPLYEKVLDVLKANGKVFACRCSRSEIEHAGTHAVYPGTCKNKNIRLDEKNVCWRLDTSEPLEIQLKEYGKKTKHYVLPENMHDFIVRRKDGLPSYQVCSLIDDVHFGIDLIVRGEDLRDSSLAQLYLAQLSGLNEFLNTNFLHHPLLLNQEGHKLSKSAGDTSLKVMREQGFSADQSYYLLGKQLGIEVHSWEDVLRF
jgi:glutamyl/glutaminyl-tRNA synthetase